MPVIDTQALVDDRVRALREYHERTGIERAELDVSGGVDSAVVLALLARALGPERVTAVYIGVHSADLFRERAAAAAAAADIPLVVLDVSEEFDRLHAAMIAGLVAAGFDEADIRARIERDRTVDGSIRSCLRAPIGRGLNRMTGGGIRHGTGNECEDRFLRFYQKGGDGEVDTNPIAMLSKGEVFQLARALGVPRTILVAVPSPDLHGIGEIHNDEDELREATGVHWTYSKVDADTGAYTHVGNIERMSRFLDGYPDLISAAEPDWDRLVEAAATGLFRHLTDREQVRAFLESARRLEASTRHKENPNCPTLGTRELLLARGVLTNELPGT